MADKWVWDGATGGGTGDDFTNAYTTLATGLTNVGVGDILRLASDHSESTSGGLTSTNGTDARNHYRWRCRWRPTGY